jgi:hypothetical protein
VNYGQTNQLLMNASDGTFDDAVDLHCSALSTYYVAIADKNNDHDLLDIVIGNAFDQINQLLINASDGTFYFNDTVDLPCVFLHKESLAIVVMKNDEKLVIVIENDCSDDIELQFMMEY